jgi:hypothetical protein
MYSKALAGYEQVVGPDHPKSRSWRDHLYTLDTVIENKVSIKSKRYKLLKKIGLVGLMLGILFFSSSFIFITLMEMGLGSLMFIYYT